MYNYVLEDGLPMLMVARAGLAVKERTSSHQVKVKQNEHLVINSSEPHSHTIYLVSWSRATIYFLS